MSNFFRNFPATNYYFGDEVLPTVVENIGIYSDTVDQVRDIVGTYQDYYIQPGERADQVSQKLYDTPDYHWTFILMNPKLRECGWPLSDREVYKKAQQDRIAGNAPSSTTKPFSDPLDIIENKIQETIMKMAVEDNAAFAAGDTQKNYGTNLWALLSSLG